MAQETIKRRRRGPALEAAMLEAAWEEITLHGYAEFTVDAVATRAGTSKAVLYRRWPSKPELAQRAIEHMLAKNPITLPDTGMLRDDVITLLRQINERRVGIATHLVASLGEFYRQTGTSLATLRNTASTGQTSTMTRILDRAIGRGEIASDQVSERIARLPLDLLRAELLTTATPMADEDIIEIVDTIFLPLVRR
jgi:AcrR family transcriptional regulator